MPTIRDPKGIRMRIVIEFELILLHFMESAFRWFNTFFSIFFYWITYFSFRHLGRVWRKYSKYTVSTGGLIHLWYAITNLESTQSTGTRSKIYRSFFWGGWGMENCPQEKGLGTENRTTCSQIHLSEYIRYFMSTVPYECQLQVDIA